MLFAVGGQQGYSGLKPGWTRISFSYYTSKEEFAFILAAVEFVAMHGHRFLPLYRFDWATGDWSFRKRTFKYHIMKAELEVAAQDLFGDAGVEAKRTRTWSSRAVEDDESKTSGGGQRYESYFERARQIAASLADHASSGGAAPPAGIDRSLILFRI